MPIYTYRCTNCKKQFEIKQAYDDKEIEICPNCKKKKLKKIISLIGAIIFKGKGFYITDKKGQRRKDEI